MSEAQIPVQPALPPFLADVPALAAWGGVLREEDLAWDRWIPQAPTVGASETRRQHVALGRYCAARALASLGVTTAGPLARRAEGGADWPAGTVGSISHTGSPHGAMAVAVAARRDAWRSVGVDVESASERRSAEKLARRIAATDEAPLAEFGSASRLALRFSAKESLYKALHPIVNRHFGFAAAALVAADPDRGTLTLELRESLGPDYPKGFRAAGRFALTPEHVYTWVGVPG